MQIIILHNYITAFSKIVIYFVCKLFHFVIVPNPLYFPLNQFINHGVHQTRCMRSENKTYKQVNFLTSTLPFISLHRRPLYFSTTMTVKASNGRAEEMNERDRERFDGRELENTRGRMVEQQQRRECRVNPFGRGKRDTERKMDR